MRHGRPNFPPLIHMRRKLSTGLSTGSADLATVAAALLRGKMPPKLSTLAATFPHEQAIYPRKSLPQSLVSHAAHARMPGKLRLATLLSRVARRPS